MGINFLIGTVYINGIQASLEDKFAFWRDYEANKIKCRMWQYNSIIDVETEG